MYKLQAWGWFSTGDHIGVYFINPSTEYIVGGPERSDHRRQGQAVGTLQPVATNALRYNTNKGVWNQYIEAFNASLLKPGENDMTFTVQFLE